MEEKNKKDYFLKNIQKINGNNDKKNNATVKYVLDMKVHYNLV
jgi:hypothetical protein